MSGKEYWYVGRTPKIQFKGFREVLIWKCPESLEPYLNQAIDWHRFETHAEALRKVEELSS